MKKMSMKSIRRVLMSVSDKTGLVPFAQGLRRLGFEIISTGGTAKLLKERGVPVQEISKFTGFQEILDGRVKTLHPKVHGGILADRQKPEHLKQARRLGLQMIDLVVVNLYPFESVAGRRKAPLAELIEQIDIGGVALIRSAAKNFQSVGILCKPSQYDEVLKELQRNRGRLSEATRFRLSVEAFSETAYYDSVIHQALAHRAKGVGTARQLSRDWPDKLVLGAVKRQTLRYGENPHQAGFWYQWPASTGSLTGLSDSRQLHGKELSFNNLLDLDAAMQIVCAFEQPCAVVIKHNSPCGIACAAELSRAFRRAFEGDPLSAFGGIVGLNRIVDKAAAKAILSAGFLECVVAPGYRPDALKLLQSKKNLRVIAVPFLRRGEIDGCIDFKQVSGGLLVQEPDRFRRDSSRWRLVTRTAPTPRQRRDLVFAWKVARFVRSNAIVIAKDEQAVGIGMGLTSRVDSVQFALRKAGVRAKGAVLASDGFFPKPDGPLSAVRAGIRAIVQPGGSVQDPEVIRVAQKAGMPMFLTGKRHFKH